MQQTRDKGLDAVCEVDGFELAAVIERIAALGDGSGQGDLRKIGFREAFVAELGESVGKIDSGELGAFEERVRADRGHVVGNIDLSQALAAGESARRDIGNSLSDGHARERIALVQDKVAPFGHAVGDHDRFQRAHLAKRIVAELGDGVGNGQRADGVVVLKHIPRDSGDALREADCFKHLHLRERFIGLSDGRGNVDLRNRCARQKVKAHRFKTLVELDVDENWTSAERLFPDRLDVRGYLDRLQRPAVLEGPGAYRCDCRREVKLLQQVAAREGVLADGHKTLGKRDAHDVVVVREGSGADLGDGRVSQLCGSGQLRLLAVVLGDLSGTVIENDVVVVALGAGLSGIGSRTKNISDNCHAGEHGRGQRYRNYFFQQPARM